MGQAKNKRIHCPALHSDIPPAECARERVNHRSCPLDCGHNPWSIANGELAVAICKSAEDKQTTRFIAVYRGREEIKKLTEGQYNPMEQSEIFYDLGIRKAGDGQDGFMDKWKASGWVGLSNDEKTVMQAQAAGFRLWLFEILQTAPPHWCLVRDLFVPELPPVWICDPVLVKFPRFSSGLARFYWLPGRWHRTGPAAMLPIQGAYSAEELLMLIADGDAKPADPAGLPRWADRGMVIADFFFSQVDEYLYGPPLGDGTEHMADYECPDLEAASLLEDLLRSTQGLEELEEDPEERENGNDDILDWSWMESESLTIPGWKRQAGDTGEYELARVRMQGRRVRLATAHGERLPELRRRFEEIAEELAVFVGETQAGPEAGKGLSDAVYLARTMPDFLKGLKFTAGNEPPPDDFYRQWLDQPCVRLEGQTPRAAATRPELRPRLETLVKSLVCQADQRRLDTGIQEDCGWLLQELGFDDLIFPAIPAIGPIQPPESAP